MNSRVNWSTKEEQFLKDNYKDYTARVLVNMLKQIRPEITRSEYSVRGKLGMMRLIKPPELWYIGESQLSKEQTLYERGYSVQRISEILQCSAPNLRERLKKAGIFKRNRNFIIGAQGEDIARQHCKQQGHLYKEMPPHHKYDLTVEGLGIDVKYHQNTFRVTEIALSKKEMGSELWLITRNNPKGFIYKYRLMEKVSLDTITNCMDYNSNVE